MQALLRPRYKLIARGGTSLSADSLSPSWFPHRILQLRLTFSANNYATQSNAVSAPEPVQSGKSFRRVSLRNEVRRPLRSRPLRSRPPKARNPRLESAKKSHAQSDPNASESNFSKVQEMMSRGILFDPASQKPLINTRELRNACKCESCVNPSDRQRNYHFAHIPDNIEVDRHEVNDEGTYSVWWKNDVPGFEHHVSIYKKSDIIRAVDAVERAGLSVLKRPVFLWGCQDIDLAASTMSYESVLTTSGGLKDLINHLAKYGLAFISSVPDEETSVKHIAERIGILRNTFYGPTWDVRNVPDAKNVAYTSRNLGFHMDLLYMHEPPGFQLLHCLENTCEGGLSRFADTFKALDILATQEGPEVVQKLVQSRIPYEYSNDGSHYHFNRSIVATGYPPLQRVFENSKNPGALEKVSRVFWSPPFVAPQMQLRGHERADETRLVKAFADVLESPDLVLTTKLSPGTCVVFDNLRIVHARTAFDTSGGHRWLKGAYVDQQDFRSKLVALG